MAGRHPDRWHGKEGSSEFIDQTSVFKACILSPEQMWSTGVHNTEPVGLEEKKNSLLYLFTVCLKGGHHAVFCQPSLKRPGQGWPCQAAHSTLEGCWQLHLQWSSLEESIRACSLCLQVFTLDVGLWLKHRKPILAPFPSSATASLDKVCNIFLPLFPNGNINQSLINLDYIVCLACKLFGEQSFLT